MRKIVVLGSTNTDMVITGKRIPVPGETVSGGTFLMNPGGKGANQAVAVARLSAKKGACSFIAKVGDDLFGRETAVRMRKDGIDAKLIVDRREPSGTALILVDAKGQNVISVALGANGALSPKDVAKFRKDIENAAALLMQLVEVGTVYAPDTWDDYGLRAEVEEAAERAGTVFVPVRDEMQFLNLGAGEATIYPPVAYTTDNETCVSVLCSFEHYDILVTGDMGEASEQLLLMLYELPDLEVYVAGHHGSKYSTSQLLLDVLRPETVLISVGENSFGHPAEETITRILSSGAEIRRTDEEGSVFIRR